MNRAEALKHFEDEYYMDARLETRESIIEYTKANRGELTINFVANFRELCKKIKIMQDEGKKGKIAYITYSFGKGNYNKESREYVVQAYEEEWYDEKSEACTITYDVDWLYKLFEGRYNELVEVSKQYEGKITSADFDEIWKDEIKGCDVRLLEFARKAIREAVEIDEFKAIDKRQVVEIRLGEHKGYNEIILKIDTRIKDSKEIKRWLEAGEKSYSYNIFRNLDLSNGNYKKLNSHYSEFIGCNLSNANFESANMLGSIIEKSIIKGTNFDKTIIGLGKLQNMTLDTSSFKEFDFIDAEALFVEFVGCNLKDVKLSSSQLTHCKFINCDLNNARLSRAFLKDVSLKGCDLKKAVFIRTEFDDVDLSETDLTEAEFIKVDFTTFKFDNAIFKGNRIKEIKVYAKDIDRLNLTEEQLKEVTIVEQEENS